MIYTALPGRLSGELRIPGSKSHTIRALIIATLAEGDSRLIAPLDSADTRSCIAACRALGARIEADQALGNLSIAGTGGEPRTPDDVIDVGNSGTTLYLAAGIAALQEGLAVFTGDEQIRSRPAAPLLVALNDLGARAESTRGDGCAPFVVGGGLDGGYTRVECRTSQYLSALLLCTPLAHEDVEIEVPFLHERPYVDMTVSWMRKHGVRVERDGYSRFRVPARQRYRSFETPIPADFSSATFFLCAAAITGSTLRLEGLDMNDTQGDRAVVEILESMGCEITTGDGAVTITGKPLTGREIDLNATPDALPALAVTACFAEGETRLANVPQAREKETDRIGVMREELARLGADIEELPDGLVIRGNPQRPLCSGAVNGHGDHRVVMSLAVAALRADGPLEIETAEAAAVTFPDFFRLLDEVRQR